MKKQLLLLFCSVSTIILSSCNSKIKPEPEPEPLGPIVDVTFKGYNCSYVGNDNYHVGEVVTFQLKPNDGYAYPKHINVIGMDDWEYNNETGLVKGTVMEEILISARSYELGVNYYVSHVIDHETYFKNDIQYTYDKETRTVTIEHDRFQNNEEEPYWVYYEIFTYNENHQLTFSSSDQNGFETRLEYIYDNNGLLTNINVTNDLSGSFRPFAYETYEYDEKGRKIKNTFEYVDENNSAFYSLYSYGEDYVEEKWYSIENEVDVLSGKDRIYTTFDYEKGTKKITYVEYLIEEGEETSTIDYSYYDVYDIKTGELVAIGDDYSEERYIYNDNSDLLRIESSFDNMDKVDMLSYYDEDGLLTNIDYFYDENNGETPDYQEEFRYNDEGLVTYWGEANSDSPYCKDITYQDLGDIDWVPKEMIEGITIGEYSYCFNISGSINF